ncbi:DUF2335 domain-containing protein [Clostridium sp. LQ25]|mgnify:CR=1 FL=1|uniref:DUF2335 domain-containing protein n=1 Tax=Clostridium TaxID=1485 RepID=UPI000696BA0F|nr:MULTISPECIES: DUF2335 domain-containing protein [Clostridium]MDU3583243.1 DUF2335 domain-containing protein [Clostridium butyricum]MDU3596532.1 DUF2335 domain-containing protein [Clostridium butyricum]UZT07957.1 DUF2335 domain-containing protein [Clostridium sp. LQ25]
MICRNNSSKISKPNEHDFAKIEERETRAQLAVTQESFSGPLPSPDILYGYDRVVPGAADRIIKMAENQMSHRFEVENNILNMHSRNTLLGIICAFVIGTIVCIGGVYCVLNDKQVSGVLFGGVGLAAVVTSFLKWTNPKIEGDSSEDNEDD